MPSSPDPQAAARAAFIAPETRFLDLPRPLQLEQGGELPVRPGAFCANEAARRGPAAEV